VELGAAPCGSSGEVTLVRKIAIRQVSIPTYRVGFFELLAERFDGSITLLANTNSQSDGVEITDHVAGCDLVKLPLRRFGIGRMHLLYQPGLVSVLKSVRPDVLVTDANGRFVDSRNASEWMQSQGCVSIGWGLGTSTYHSDPAGVRRRLKSWSFRQFDGMIGYSETAKAQYVESGVPEKRVFVAHNSTRRRPAKRVPDELAAGSNVPCVLFVGRLVATKHIDRLIEAFAKLRTQAKLWIVGDGPERNRLEELSTKIGAPVAFLGRQVGDELQKIAAAADLFVLPSLGGLAIQEAMSFGLPVIAAIADGTERDLVRDSNGWILPDATQQTLTDTIENALSSSSLLAMGLESHRIVRDEINVDLMVDRFLLALRAIDSLGPR